MSGRRETGQFLTGHRKGEKKTPGKDSNTSLALPETGLNGSPSRPSICHQETEMMNADEELAGH